MGLSIVKATEAAESFHTDDENHRVGGSASPPVPWMIILRISRSASPLTSLCPEPWAGRLLKHFLRTKAVLAPLKTSTTWVML